MSVPIFPLALLELVAAQVVQQTCQQIYITLHYRITVLGTYSKVPNIRNSDYKKVHDGCEFAFFSDDKKLIQKERDGVHLYLIFAIKIEFLSENSRKITKNDKNRRNFDKIWGNSTEFYLKIHPKPKVTQKSIDCTLNFRAIVR